MPCRRHIMCQCRNRPLALESLDLQLDLQLDLHWKHDWHLDHHGLKSHKLPNLPWPSSRVWECHQIEIRIPISHRPTWQWMGLQNTNLIIGSYWLGWRKSLKRVLGRKRTLQALGVGGEQMSSKDSRWELGFPQGIERFLNIFVSISMHLVKKDRQLPQICAINLIHNKMEEWHRNWFHLPNLLKSGNQLLKTGVKLLNCLLNCLHRVAESLGGTLFSADLVDERGVETRAVFFNKEVWSISILSCFCPFWVVSSVKIHWELMYQQESCNLSSLSWCLCDLSFSKLFWCWPSGFPSLTCRVGT